MSWPKDVLTYIKKLLDPTAPDAELLHATYLACVVTGILWLSGDLIAKEINPAHSGIDGNWDTAFGILLAAVTGGKVFGKRDGSPVPPEDNPK